MEKRWKPSYEDMVVDEEWHIFFPLLEKAISRAEKAGDQEIVMCLNTLGHTCQNAGTKYCDNDEWKQLLALLSVLRERNKSYMKGQVTKLRNLVAETSQKEICKDEKDMFIYQAIMFAYADRNTILQNLLQTNIQPVTTSKPKSHTQNKVKEIGYEDMSPNISIQTITKNQVEQLVLVTKKKNLETPKKRKKPEYRARNVVKTLIDKEKAFVIHNKPVPGANPKGIKRITIKENFQDIVKFIAAELAKKHAEKALVLDEQHGIATVMFKSTDKNYKSSRNIRYAKSA